MKIFTNIKKDRVGGIAQSLSSFVNFVSGSKRKKIRITGLDISSNSQVIDSKSIEGNFALITANAEIAPIKQVISNAQGIDYVRQAYAPVIEKYSQYLKLEKPDVVLINGTYFLPWSLLMASQNLGIPTVIHYHGILTKETSHWDEKSRMIFTSMEKCFDQKNLHYIFPSLLTQKVVEEEVFGHKVKQFSILPNAIPNEFFSRSKKRNSTNIGVVGRWTEIKNPKFFKHLAKYNAKRGNQFTLNVVSNMGDNHKDRVLLEGSTNFIKPMGNEKLAKFYRSMGVIVSPSHFETYGNVAQEALASGTPALVNSNMGVAETFRFLGLDDWIIKFDSVSSVYKKVKEVIGAPVPQHVHDKMKETFSTDNLHNQMLKILSNQ